MGEVEVLKSQGGGEELFECRRDVTFGLPEFGQGIRLIGLSVIEMIIETALIEVIAMRPGILGVIGEFVVWRLVSKLLMR